MSTMLIVLMSIMAFVVGMVAGSFFMLINHTDIYDKFILSATKRTDLKLFESAFYYSNIGFFLVDQDGSFKKANRSACEMLEYSETELLTMKFQDITHLDDLEKDLAQYSRMLSGEIRTYKIRKRYVKKYGDIFNAVLTVSAVYEQNGRLHLFISQIEEESDTREINA